MTLYNISDAEKSHNSVTKIPAERVEIIKVTRDVLKSYMTNVYGGNRGHANIKALATPLHFSNQGTYGAFLYCSDILNRDDVQKLQWFNMPTVAGEQAANNCDLTVKNIQLPSL